jgi:RNA polymerase sigma-70 factor (ECF subfamily)
MPAEPPDTEALLALAAKGDRQAQDGLLNRHRERLKRMIAVRMDHRLRKRIDPSDVVQETLMVANRRLETYLREQPIPFYPWLRQLAWDQLVAFQRKHLYAGRRSRRREEDLGAALSDESVAGLASCVLDQAADPLRKMVRSELTHRVRQAVERLPATYREVLVLRHLEQLSTAETAEILGIGKSAVKMRHLRALERLKGLLDAPGWEEAE